MIKKSLYVLALVSILLMICSCGNKKSRLAGNWTSTEFTESSDYPVIMTLNEDGTGTCDGFSLNWTEKDGRFMITIPFGSYSYDYEIRNSKLYLDGHEYEKAD